MMLPTRRSFLGSLAATGLAVTLPIAGAKGRMLPRRAIPGHDEALPIIGLGSTKPVRLIESEGTAPIEAVLQTLLDHGGCVVDTAPRPADLDRAFGQVLQKPAFGNKLFLAVKINAAGKDAGLEQFRQLQRHFGRKVFDLVQIESLTQLEVHWPTLQSLRASGDARYAGVTVAHEEKYAMLESFMRRETPDFVQLNYSVIEHSAEDVLLPLAKELNIAVLVNGPFMNGEYFQRVRGLELPDWSAAFECRSWADFSLKYVLSNSAVTCVLTETTNPRHMQENIAAAYGPFPDAAMRARMRKLANTL
jgi:diketogulonate reductase-like aldo/keto reductase